MPAGVVVDTMRRADKTMTRSLAHREQRRGSLQPGWRVATSQRSRCADVLPEPQLGSFPGALEVSTTGSRAPICGCLAAHVVIALFSLVLRPVVRA